MTVAENLRKICAAARPAIEAALDAAEELSEIREAASEQGLDWSQVKALLKAQIQDERDGGERVKKLAAKADNALTYAAMISLNNVAEKQKTPPQSKPQLAASTSSPPTRGDEAVPRVPSGAASPISEDRFFKSRMKAVRTPTAAASPISEAAPALGVVGGDRTDTASSHSAADRKQATSLANGGGNLAGTETSGHSLSETDAVGTPASGIVEPAVTPVSIPSDEIEPAREAGLPTGSPVPKSRGGVESRHAAVHGESRRTLESAREGSAAIAPSVTRGPHREDAAGVAPGPREADTDPSLDIRNQPFYRGGETWPR
jgi:hypothetical protein